jgi:hypothetical protein
LCSGIIDEENVDEEACHIGGEWRASNKKEKKNYSKKMKTKTSASIEKKMVGYGVGFYFFSQKQLRSRA